MDQIILFFQNYSLLFVIILPMIYFVTRDVIDIVKRKNQKKEAEIQLRQSEERILEQMKTLELNRTELIKQLSIIEKKINISNENPNVENDDTKKT